MYDYSTQGLLSLNQDALGGYHRYEVTRTTNMQTVTETTALGRVTSYAYTRNKDKSSNFRITFPTGMQNVRNVDANGVSTTTLSDGTVNTSTLVPDPKLGAQSMLANETTTTPGGRTRTTHVTRSVAQTSPTNPLSLTTLTETTTDNGRVSTRAFAKSNRTWTGTSPASRVATIQLDGQRSTAALPAQPCGAGRHYREGRDSRSVLEHPLIARGARPEPNDEAHTARSTSQSLPLRISHDSQAARPVVATYRIGVPAEPRRRALSLSSA